MLFLIGILSIPLVSCKKYLDEKAVKSLVVPRTLDDLQALLDLHDYMNKRGPHITELIADNYYMKTADFLSRDLDLRQQYLWDPNAATIGAWNLGYQQPVYYANVVLDVLPEINPSENDKARYNAIKGSALFYRAFAFQRLSDLFCKPYSTSANSDPGIVLRLSAAIEDKSVRSTVQQTYDQIINDLKLAAELLPEVSLFPTRPNKAAVYGVLARTYLTMRDYVNAGHYADLYLQKYNSLIDFNTLFPLKNPPFERFNKETIYYSVPTFTNFLASARARIDSTLYKSYADNDLRKVVYYQANTGVNAGTYGFRGSYEGTTPSTCFDGIATDEMYFIRSECFARSGQTVAALDDLNMVLSTRWKTGFFTPFTVSNADEALRIILTERRKELVYRGLRWSDIRRLNLEGANITLTRIINNVTYTLPPNDLRSVLLIPPTVISMTGVEQNPR